MNRIICLIVLNLLTALHIEAKDFGKAGQSFEITEEGFIAMIKRKLEGIDMDKEKARMQELTKERVNNPPAVMGITRATETREFYFDPSVEVKEDILLPGGEVLHKAGTKVNPLDHINLDRRIIFIDGRDNEQLEWLTSELARFREHDEKRAKEAAENSAIAPTIINRVILTGGKIMELQKSLGLELFFDQAGELIDKFGIRAVPAIAVQEGKKIRIKEVALNEQDD